MKIAVLISSLRAGGAERVAATLCNYWATQNHQISLITLDALANDFYPLKPGIGRYAVGSYTASHNVWQKIWKNLRRVVGIRKQIQAIHPDVVLSFMDVSNMQAILACAFTGIPVIVSERTYPPFYNDNNLFDRVRKFLYKFATAIVVQTRQIAEWAAEFLPEQKINIIANPLNIDLLQQAPAMPIDKAKSIIAVGRLCPEKGFDLLIDAYKQCQAKFPDWHLLIVGEGQERAKLQQQITNLGLDTQVKLIGQTARPQDYYASGQIFALSSRVEGFPNVLLEAMAHGLAVVSFDCRSGPADLISDRINGLLVPSEQITPLATALQELMQDSQLRANLGREALKVREIYTTENISAQWLEVFVTCIKKP